MEKKELKFIVIKSPFDRTKKELKTIDYKKENIYNLVKENIDINFNFDFKLAVSINGLQIPEEDWQNTYLKVGDELVVVPILCGGGGDDGLGLTPPTQVLQSFLCVAINITAATPTNT